MTSLVVLLPGRNLERVPSDWDLGALPFVLFDDNGQQLRKGYASLPMLPRAKRHVLLLSVRDVVLLRAKVPALKGPRLRLALPNLIEDQLIGDASRCHCAAGPAGTEDGLRQIAVVDRAWFRFIVEQFQADDRTSLRAVPVLTCLAAPDPGSVVATIFGHAGPPPTDGVPSFDVALQDSASLCGASVPSGALESTAREFAGLRPLSVRVLADAAAQLAVPADLNLLRWTERAETLALDALARLALDSDLDLCQFEFSAQALKSARNSLRRWRLPLGLAAATILVSLFALNIDWMLLVRERSALEARANALLMESFPKTTTVLDAPVQMTRDLAALRTSAGQPDNSDFLVLCDRLSRALGPMGPDAIASVDYANRALTVAFAAGVVVDAGWAERLRSVGLMAEPSGPKWIVRSLS